VTGYLFPLPDAATATATELVAAFAGHPSADGLVPDSALPITRGPLTTRDIARLRPVATVLADADAVGFHTAIVRPQTFAPDGSRQRPSRTDYLTCGTDDDARILLRFPDDGPEYTRLLDLLTTALADGMGGTFHFDLRPDPDDRDGWQITASRYDDSEGERS
jgi:hypothetical protein